VLILIPARSHAAKNYRVHAEDPCWEDDTSSKIIHKK